MTPDITIIVCTYNRCESLRDTLRALAAQAAPGLALEILVVDNNSTDATKTVVETAAAESRWPVRYVFEQRQGLTRARNRGIEESRGGWIAFTDDDVIPEPGWVSAVWQAAQAFGADAVGGRILPLWLGEPPAWLQQQNDLWGVLALLDRGPEPIVAALRNAYCVYGANMAFRKSLFAEIGGFREDLGVAGRSLLRGDDTEFVVRAVQAGKRIVYAPQAVVHHKVPARRMRLSYFRQMLFQTGRSEALMEPGAYGRFPRWLVRRCLEDGFRTLRAYGSGGRKLGVQQELLLWRHIGQLVGTMKRAVPWQAGSVS